MTEDVDTTPRRRGRPRKVEDHQAVETIEVREAVPLDEFMPSANIAAENEAMQNQIRYQLAAMIKMAQQMGIDPFEGFAKPPTETTKVVEARRPGQVLGDGLNTTWVPWRKSDLEGTDYHTFVPQPIPSLVFPIPDENGNLKIKLDVNDLVCWLTVGVPNTVHMFFYNAYQNAYDSWRELENFKRKGPEIAPWGRIGPDGRPSWHYDPQALSYAMDIDGRYLSPHRQTPIQDVQADNPEAI